MGQKQNFNKSNRTAHGGMAITDHLSSETGTQLGSGSGNSEGGIKAMRKEDLFLLMNQEFQLHALRRAKSG